MMQIQLSKVTDGSFGWTSLTEKVDTNGYYAHDLLNIIKDNAQQLGIDCTGTHNVAAVYWPSEFDRRPTEIRLLKVKVERAESPLEYLIDQDAY